VPFLGRPVGNGKASQDNGGRDVGEKGGKRGGRVETKPVGSTLRGTAKVKGKSVNGAVAEKKSGRKERGRK